jgi:hypothetical protein
MGNWLLAGWLTVALFGYLLIRGGTMLDINAIEAEVAAELRDEEQKRAKQALKQNARDIAAAKQVLANLERKKLDIIAAIGDGTL